MAVRELQLTTPPFDRAQLLGAVLEMELLFEVNPPESCKQRDIHLKSHIGADRK